VDIEQCADWWILSSVLIGGYRLSSVLIGGYIAVCWYLQRCWVRGWFIYWGG